MRRLLLPAAAAHAMPISAAIAAATPPLRADDIYYAMPLMMLLS